MKMKALIFDMDGTLVDSLGGWEVLWAACSKEYLGGKPFALTPEDDHIVRTLTLKDALELVHKNYGIAESGEALLNFTNDFFKEFYITDVKLKEGVREFLDYCLKNGIKMCMASATAPILLNVAVSHHDLGKYFCKIFSCADIGIGKERPDIFLMAKDYMGEALEDTWVVEDSLTALKTARDAGFKTIGIFDCHTPRQDEIEAVSTIYIDDGETLNKVIDL